MIETIHQPTSLAEALQVLHDGGEDTRPLAGGQSLLVLLRHGLLDLRSLVSLRWIPELRRIEAREGGLRIGATVTQREIEASPIVRETHSALREAAMAVASTQVRNRGTLAGNLCHADPSADPPAALIALGARVEIASRRGTRDLPIEDLFADFLATRLEADEIVTAVVLPAPASESRYGSAYLKHSLRAVDPALAGVGVWLRLDERGVCVDARVGLAGVGLTPLRATGTEAALRGQRPSPAVWREAAETAARECSPIDDLEASAWYRRRMVRVYLERAARLAATRAGWAS